MDLGAVKLSLRKDTAVKVTKEQSAEHRDALVRTAARLFREHGIDGIGVAEISKQAGLTHGALYAQFPSKQALVAAALAHGLERGYVRLTQRPDGAAATLADYLDLYVSRAARDNLAMGCPMAASASEIARQDKEVSAQFTEGYLQLSGLIEAALAGASGPDPRRRALAMVAAMIGGVAVARATAKADPQLSDDILAATRSMLDTLREQPAAKRTPRAPPHAARSTARRPRPRRS